MRVEIRLGRGLAFLATVVGCWWPGHARAESRFPPLLTETVGVPCIPSCLACHLTDPGDATNWSTKPLGLYVGTHRITKSSSDADVVSVLQQFLADAQSEPTKADVVEALRQGNDAWSGNNLCNGPIYGCGAHVARASTTRDLTIAPWLVAALGAGALFRRRRARAG
jgi:hypothetical protein